MSHSSTWLLTWTSSSPPLPSRPSFCRWPFVHRACSISYNDVKCTTVARSTNAQLSSHLWLLLLASHIYALHEFRMA
ncbi:hypothetical protein CC79DRAFT_819202 [Sarocladium strictum]